MTLMTLMTNRSSLSHTDIEQYNTIIPPKILMSALPCLYTVGRKRKALQVAKGGKLFFILPCTGGTAIHALFWGKSCITCVTSFVHLFIYKNYSFIH